MLNKSLPAEASPVPIVISEGSYYIESDGTLHFTHPTFKGPVDIAYTICDENGFLHKCNCSHHGVRTYESVCIRVYLEGPYDRQQQCLLSIG